MHDLSIEILCRTKAAKRLMSTRCDLTHLISISDAEGQPEAIRGRPATGYYKFANKKLRLHFDDDPTDTVVGPKEHHIRQILDFAEVLRQDLEKGPCKLMVHCWAGKRRSSAAVLIVLAYLWGPGREAEAMRKILDVRPIAIPNIWMTALGDRLLDRGGSLEAVLPPACYVNES